MIAPLFNLLVNSAFSLLAGWLVVNFFLWLFRVPLGRSQIILLSLPFVKMLFDFARGIPSSSILWSGIDPFDLPPKSQVLSFTAGTDQWGPFFRAGFSVLDITGHPFSASVGDYLWAALNRWVKDDLLFYIVTTVIFISFIRLTRRALEIFKFNREQKRDREASEGFASLSMRFRKIDIYISKNFRGSPFTGGFLKPYICIPQEAFQQLTPSELQAVIHHETAHVENFDVITSLLVQALGDFFWFVPGYRRLRRQLENVRELWADHCAVAKGADPMQLASALLRLQDHRLQARSKKIPVPAFLRRRVFLKTRIEVLMQSPPPRARWGWQNIWIRGLLLMIITATALMSTFGGNHPSHLHVSQSTDLISQRIYIAQD